MAAFLTWTFIMNCSNTKYMLRTLTELEPTGCHLVIVTNEPSSELEPIPADQGAAEMTVEGGVASDEWSDVYASELLAPEMDSLIALKLNSHHQPHKQLSLINQKHGLS